MLLAFATQVLADNQNRQDVGKRPRVVHVIVALADNKYQGIVPVPRAIGSGDDPANNLYWGCNYGVKTWFQKSTDWELVGKCHPSKYPVLERCVFKHKKAGVHLVADAYRGREIKQAIGTFFSFAAGRETETLVLGNSASVSAGGGADLVAYIGHDGLMDFALDRYRQWADNKRRDAIILACASKQYFADALRWTGARPLLWTTNLMAPEAYTLDAALTGWISGEAERTSKLELPERTTDISAAVRKLLGGCSRRAGRHRTPIKQI